MFSRITRTFLNIAILLVLINVFFIVRIYAFSEPTAPPPSVNAAAPINVSNTAQTKTGDFVVSNASNALVTSDLIRTNSYATINTSRGAGYSFLVTPTFVGATLTNAVLTVKDSNVGIGTTTPIGALDIYNTTDSRIRFEKVGSSISFIGNGTFYDVWNGQNTDMRFATNGTEYMRLTSTGNVGVGTSNPLNRLQIGTQIPIGSAAPITLSLGGTYSSTAGANSKLKLYDDGSSIYGMGVSAGQMDFTIPGATSFVWYTGGAEKMRINSAGNVGIGNSAPAYKLDVTGDVNTTGCFRQSGGPCLSGGSGGVGPGTLNFVAKFTPDGTHVGNSTISDDGIGNVVVGTLTSPSSHLDLLGSSATRLRIQSTDSTQGPRLVLTNHMGHNLNLSMGGILEDPTGGLPDTGYIYTGASNGLAFSATDLSGFMAFTTGGSFAANERIRITATGNVGIGTKTPGAKLDVNGNLNVSGSITAGVKDFAIDHPLKSGYQLVHSSLEGPEIGVYYRGTAQLLDGKAKIILPDYFDALTRDHEATVLLTAKGTTPFLLSYDQFDEKSFIVYGTKSDGEFDWEVKSVRSDMPPLEVERKKQ